MNRELLDLTGRVVLITGAGSIGGQGEAEARLFAEHGARVVLADLPSSNGQTIANSIGDNAMFVELDVTQEDQWSAVTKIVGDVWGTPNVLVNTAGAWLMKDILGTSLAEYEHVVSTNQTAIFLGMATVLPGMITAGGGVIVNTCSVSGMKGGNQPFAYAASKWAVRGMTRVVAHDHAKDGIRANSISPGVVDTQMIEGGKDALDDLASMIPSGRVSRPEEIATIALFLASDASSYISGIEVTADAALTA